MWYKWTNQIAQLPQVYNIGIHWIIMAIYSILLIEDTTFVVRRGFGPRSPSGLERVCVSWGLDLTPFGPRCTGRLFNIGLKADPPFFACSPKLPPPFKNPASVPALSFSTVSYMYTYHTFSTHPEYLKA